MPFTVEPGRDRTLFRLVKQATSSVVPKGRTIYAPGDPAEDVWLVRDGWVRLVLPGMEQGRSDRTVSVALPWRVFGDEALTEGHRRYGAVSGARCTVQALSAGKVLRGLKTARKTLDAYLEGLERELHRLRHAQGGSQGPTAPQRLAEVLLDLGERCGEPVGRGIQLSVKLTHHVLADLAGAHRATVTTLLNEWLYEKVLTTDARGCLVLARPTRLWSLAGYHPAGEHPGRWQLAGQMPVDEKPCPA